MRAAIDLELSGSRLRILSEVTAAGSVLRKALARHVVDGPCDVGFLLKAPDGRNGLHVLVDRSGFVLARTRTWEQCVAVLASHLVTFLPPAEPSIRLRMRGIVISGVSGGRSRVTLAQFPLLSIPPVIERKLARDSMHILDRLAVDLTSDLRLHVDPVPWPDLQRSESPTGHWTSVEPTARAPEVTKVLVPRLTSQAPSAATLIASLATCVMEAEPDRALDIAEALQPLVTLVPINDATERDSALGGA